MSLTANATCVTFRSWPELAVLRTTSPGRLILTNQRLLLLSATNWIKTSLTVSGDPKKLPGGYEIEDNLNDTIEFQPLPVSALKTVHLLAQTGMC